MRRLRALIVALGLRGLLAVTPIVCLLALTPATVHADVGFVQACGGTTSQNIFSDLAESVSCTLTNGNGVIVAVFTGNSGAVLSVDDDGTTTYASRISQNGNGVTEIFCGIAAGGATSVTVSTTEDGGGGQFGLIRIIEFSGLTCTEQDDTSATPTSTTSHTTGQISTTGTHALIFAFHAIAANDNTKDDDYDLDLDDDTDGLLTSYRITTTALTNDESIATNAGGGTDSWNIATALEGTSGGGGGGGGAGRNRPMTGCCAPVEYSREELQVERPRPRARRPF